MSTVEDSFKPIETALAHGFTRKREASSWRSVRRTYWKDDQNLIIGVQIDYDFTRLTPGIAELTVGRVSPLWHLASPINLVRLPFKVNENKYLDRFENDADYSLRLWVPGQELSDRSCSYTVSYVLEEEGSHPSIARVSEVYGYDQTAHEGHGGFTREVSLRSRQYREFLQASGLPERVDFLKTLRMYTEGQYEEGGQVIPLSVESIAKNPVLAA